MKFHKNKFLTTIAAAALALAVGACSSNGDSANVAVEEDLSALQEAFGEDELTPDAITALRDQLMMLMARAELTPAEVQALRDEITMLMARAELTPAEVQALRDQIASLMVGSDITPADVQALRDEITMLMARADLTPAEVQALRDQISDLMASTPAEIQALRDRIDVLMARADITPEAVDALRERIVTLNGEVAMLMGQADITPAAVQALRDEITSLTSQVAALMATTPAEIQGLRDQIVTLTARVMTLMGREDITPEGAQALRNEIAILMLRATLSQADYDALVAALGEMPLTVATLEMLVDDYNKNKSAKVDEAAAEASARALGILAVIMDQTTGDADGDIALTVEDGGTLMPFAKLTASNTMADGVAVLLNAVDGESEFEEATDRAAPAINGWDHVLLAKVAGDDSSTELVAVYTDVDLPGPKSLLADEGVDLTADTPALFFIVTNDPDGDGSQTPNEAFVMHAETDMFPNAPATGSTTVVLGSLVTRPGTTVERLEFPGTWRGVPGTFICSTQGQCNTQGEGISVSAELNDKGEEVLMATFADGREWVFQPTDKAATADVADEDYLYFGWWKNEPAEKTGETPAFAYGFRTFASGSQPFDADGMTKVEGRATYSGAATGKYALEKGSRLAPQYEADAFTARASLTASFGGSDVAGTIKGTITDFVNANPAGTSLANWKVTLNEILLMADDVAFESTDGGTSENNAVAEIGGVMSDSGVWSGEFFGNGREDGQPGSVAGRFSATFMDANTHIAGSYGAQNVSDDE